MRVPEAVDPDFAAVFAVYARGERNETVPNAFWRWFFGMY